MTAPQPSGRPAGADSTRPTDRAPGAKDPKRVRAGKLAQLDRWSRVVDRSAATAPARRAAEARFEKQVDPDGLMDPETRRKAAAAARKAYYLRLAQMGVEARRRSTA